MEEVRLVKKTHFHNQIDAVPYNPVQTLRLVPFKTTYYVLCLHQKFTLTVGLANRKSVKVVTTVGINEELHTQVGINSLGKLDKNVVFRGYLYGEGPLRSLELMF